MSSANSGKADQNQTEYKGINRFLRSETLQIASDKRGDGTFRDFFDDWKWIFAFSKNHKRSIAVYTVMGLVSSTLSLLTSVLSKYLIDIITGYRYDMLGVLIVGMVLSAVVGLITAAVSSRVAMKISIRVNNAIQADIFGKIVDADWQSVTAFENGDLLNRFNTDTRTISTNAVSWLPKLLVNIYSFLAIFFVILYYDKTMALFAFICAPVVLLVSRRVMRRSRIFQKRVKEIDSDMMSFSSEFFYNYDTIKSFGATGHYEKELHKWQARYRDYNLEYNLYTIRLNAGMKGLTTAVTLIAFLYCLFRMWTGEISYGTMTLFLTQCARLINVFGTMAGSFPTFISAAVSARRVREITDLPTERHDPAGAKAAYESADEGFTVRMDSVTFGYRAGSVPVIRDCSLTARPREIVALTGSSGEGKTTLLRLILGLVGPQSGSVSLTVADGTAYDVSADLRGLFSYVPQGNTLLAGTIADNLRMACEDASDDEIREALSVACALDFVEKLPDGIDTVLGEKGGGLSEGQAQRIAIARAVLRDAPVLLLDEATSALDADTERRVLENIMRRGRSKTCIVSTHRESVLAMCSRHYHVAGGQVREVTPGQPRAQ